MSRGHQIIEMLTKLFESQQQADGDFCGEQREWHLPRLNKAAALSMVLFPAEAVEAMVKAKDPDGNMLMK